MSIQDTITADRASIFGKAGNTPISKQAVYTPPGDIPQPGVTLLFSDTPLHGDEQQVYPVKEAETYALGASPDVSSWVKNGVVNINSTDYELVNAPYAKDGFWSVIHLRLSTETLI